MWAQTWSNIGELATPYPSVKSEDVTPYLQEQVLISITLSRYVHLELHSDVAANLTGAEENLKLSFFRDHISDTREQRV